MFTGTWTLTYATGLRGYAESADHFVIPYGHVGSETLEIIEDYHYTNYLSSNILSGTPSTDPLTIERVRIDDVAYAKRQIDRAARYNMLVVLSAHTVGNLDDRWISHEGFVEILDYIQESSIEVPTPTDYWDKFLRSSFNHRLLRRILLTVFPVLKGEDSS